MNDYTKGILTGASLILCFIMFVSAKRQGVGEFLGAITVTSVTIVDENANIVGLLSSDIHGGALLALSRPKRDDISVLLTVDERAGGYIHIRNADGKETAYLGSGGGSGGGILNTFSTDGKGTVYLGTGEGGGGFVRTYNKFEAMTGYFGTNKDNDGMVGLSNRYGDPGWSETGKK